MALNQITTVGESGGAVASPRQSTSLLEQIVAAASNPEVDADKMKAMADLALQLQEHEQRQQFNRDLAAAMMEMPRISKRNEIVIPGRDGRAGRVQGRFASWENIDAVIRPILARFNLALRFDLGGDTNGTYCAPILVHTNGWVEKGEALRVPPDTSGSKNAAQAIGSSSQYAKRYAACAALNIVTEGDDRDGTNYPLADDAMNDRQIRLVAEARQSHADGNFATWWERQVASDREWLILKGVYAELTGAPQIAGPRTIPVDEQDTGEDMRADNTEPEIRDSPREEKGTQRDTAADNRGGRDPKVDRYIAKIEECENTDQVLVINEDQGTLRWLKRLSEDNKSEWERATNASSRHFATLMAKEDSAERGEGLFDR